MFDLVGIGNPVYDSIITPFSRTDGRVLSGCSTNGCLAAKRLGLDRVGLIGSIGSDYADRLRSDLHNYGLSASLDSANSDTGGFHLEYDHRGNRTLQVLGIAERISSRNIPDEFLDTKFFLIGPILGEVDLDLVRYIRTSSKAKLFLDPQGLIRLVGEDGKIIHECDKNQFSKVLDLVDFVKPNEPESVTITGLNETVQALKRLRQMGTAFPIITLAERGSMFMLDNSVYRISAYQTTAIDPTGAGDVYGGSFIVEYLRTEDYVESALFASAASSMMVEQVGPDFKLQLNEVKRRKESIRAALVKTSCPQYRRV
jgi:sugar/nucleoside kinase (ribokinase family)